MKNVLLIIISTIIFPLTGFSQDWHSSILVESKTGYTTNTYLNPFLSEWDRTSNLSYVLFSPMGQLAMSTNRFSADLALGGIYEPFFDGRDAWSGFFTLLGSRFRVTDDFSLGMEGGASRYSTITNRDLYWVQPVLSWSPNIFTQVRFKAGSSFRKFRGNLEMEQETKRFDSYSVEFEAWPTFKWQLKSSLYGNLDDPASSLGLRFSADYRLTNAITFATGVGLDRYEYQILNETGGGPPIGGPAMGGNQILNESDRLSKIGLGGSYQVNRNIAITLHTDFLNYYSSASDQSSNDFNLSVGIRFSLFPKIGDRNKADVEWKQNGKQIISLRINQPDSGQLYIVGDFNEWNQPGVALSRKSRNNYVAQLSLEPGVYEYKILLVEGSERTWVDFSDDTYTVPDGFGDENGLIFIE